MTEQRPTPAGFGRCAVCAYRDTGSPRICFGCARETMEGLADERCEICDLPPAQDAGACGNPICNWDDRYFKWNYAAAMRSGTLQVAIGKYKYQGRRGWRKIFARVLVGFLDEQYETFSAFDLIVASPSFVSPDSGRGWDHTRDVILEAFDLADGRWPFDIGEPAAIIKTAATTAMVRKNWRERKEIAQHELWPALEVPHPEHVTGRRVLVYDDVFTDGHTLNTVARALVEDGGATRVCGVTLARQPWRR